LENLSNKLIKSADTIKDNLISGKWFDITDDSIKNPALFKEAFQSITYTKSTKSIVDQKTSADKLDEVINKYGDVNVAIENGIDNDNRKIYDHKYMWPNQLKTDLTDLHILKSGLSKYDGIKKKVVPTGIYWYPPNSYLGWHTNSIGIDSERLYLVWCDKDNESFFRYKDPESGKIITKWEKSGWQINKFKVGDNNPLFWHCVGSYSNRISIGFKITLFTKPIIKKR